MGSSNKKRSNNNMERKPGLQRNNEQNDKQLTINEKKKHMWNV